MQQKRLDEHTSQHINYGKITEQFRSEIENRIPPYLYAWPIQ